MILLFGPVGAGKSVQGQMLADSEGWKWLSTGQMFRDSTDTTIKERIERGDLISDEQTYQVLDAAVHAAKAEQYPGIIFDGFPRTTEQADWLVSYQTKLGEIVDVVVVLDVPEDEVVDRLMKRGRAEDTPEKIKHRLAIYHQTTEPVLEVLARNNIRIVHTDGTGSTSEVHARVCAEVAKAIRS